MNLIDMPREERYAMMRKHHSFLNVMVKSYTSLKNRLMKKKF